MSRTALYAEHLALGAKMTDFHGWDMPLYYTSILDEHAAVRHAVGLFDISHMGQVLLGGPGILEMLNELVVSDLEKVGEGRACYTLITNERGGIVDDIIVYRVGPQEYLVIINCGNREKDVQWFRAHATSAGQIQAVSDGRCIIAVQGPRAAALVDEVFQMTVSSLGRFDIQALPKFGPHVWIARTGYTGSDGFELFAPDHVAVRVWGQFLEHGQPRGIKPIGLGARDTLRLEAGLRLYGTDMDDATTPYEVGLGWTVAIHKSSFLGKTALLEQQAKGLSRKFIGFELGEGPVPRQGCALMYQDRQVGVVTSGTFSPELKKSIGMGYVEPALATTGASLGVMIRNRVMPATVVKLPFWTVVKPGSVRPLVAADAAKEGAR